MVEGLRRCVLRELRAPPLDEEWQDFDPKKDTAKKGVWNVMPVLRRDHGGCVGLGVEGFFKPEYIRDYYNEYFAMLAALD